MLKIIPPQREMSACISFAANIVLCQTLFKPFSNRLVEIVYYSHFNDFVTVINLLYTTAVKYFFFHYCLPSCPFFC